MALILQRILTDEYCLQYQHKIIVPLSTGLFSQNYIRVGFRKFYRSKNNCRTLIFCGQQLTSCRLQKKQSQFYPESCKILNYYFISIATG